MEEFILKPTKDTLDIQCKNGSISLKGNSLLPNPNKFFKPVFEWLTLYLANPAHKTEICLQFQYLDTASVQSIFDMLKLIDEKIGKNNQVVVNWYYELDDPELLEVGEIMEGRLDMSFNYIEYSA